jgi:hypothetical protein
MLLSPHYVWLEPVLLAAVLVFVIALIGDVIEFNNRFVNALVTAILFALVFGALVYAGYGKLAVPVATTPAATTPAN